MWSSECCLTGYQTFYPSRSTVSWYLVSRRLFFTMYTLDLIDIRYINSPHNNGPDRSVSTEYHDDKVLCIHLELHRLDLEA